MFKYFKGKYSYKMNLGGVKVEYDVIFEIFLLLFLFWIIELWY